MLLRLSVTQVRIVGRAHQIAQAFGHRKAAAYMFKRGIDFTTAYAVLFNRPPQEDCSAALQHGKQPTL